jgi:hypothetical protein
MSKLEIQTPGLTMGTFLREMDPATQAGLMSELVHHSNTQTEALSWHRQQSGFKPARWHLERLIVQQLLLDASQKTFVRTEAVMGLVREAMLDCEKVKGRYTLTIKVPKHGVVQESYMTIISDGLNVSEAKDLARKHASVQMFGTEKEAERIEVVSCFLGTHKDLK